MATPQVPDGYPVSLPIFRPADSPLHNRSAASFWDTDWNLFDQICTPVFGASSARWMNLRKWAPICGSTLPKLESADRIRRGPAGLVVERAALSEGVVARSGFGDLGGYQSQLRLVQFHDRVRTNLIPSARQAGRQRRPRAANSATVCSSSMSKRRLGNFLATPPRWEGRMKGA